MATRERGGPRGHRTQGGQSHSPYDGQEIFLDCVDLDELPEERADESGENLLLDDENFYACIDTQQDGPLEAAAGLQAGGDVFFDCISPRDDDSDAPALSLPAEETRGHAAAPEQRALQTAMQRASAAEQKLLLHAEDIGRAGVERELDAAGRELRAGWAAAASSSQRRAGLPPRSFKSRRQRRWQRGRPTRCGLRSALAAALAASVKRAARLRERCAALQHSLGRLRKRFRRRTNELRGRLAAERQGRTEDRCRLQGSLADAASLRQRFAAERQGRTEDRCRFQESLADAASLLRVARCSDYLTRSEQSARDAISAEAVAELSRLAAEAKATVPRWRASCGVPIARRRRRPTARAAAKAPCRPEESTIAVGDEYVWGRKVRRRGYFDDVHRRRCEPDRHARKIDRETLLPVTKLEFAKQYATRYSIDGPEVGYDTWLTAQSYTDYVLRIYTVAYCIGQFVRRRWAPVSRTALAVISDQSHELAYIWRETSHLYIELQTNVPQPAINCGISVTVQFIRALREMKQKVWNLAGTREQKHTFERRADAWLYIMKVYRCEFRDLVEQAINTRMHMWKRHCRMLDVLEPKPNGEPWT